MLNPIAFMLPEALPKEKLVPEMCQCSARCGQGAGDLCDCGSLSGGGAQP